MFYEQEVLQKKLNAIKELLATTDPKERGFLSHLLMRKREIETLLQKQTEVASS